MNCPICRQGRLKPGSADQVLSLDGTTLVVKSVPADVCDTCGEPYFSATVTQRLLDLARDAAREGVVVDVRRFIAA